MSEELILASASPIRAHILAAAGLDFRIEAAALDEEMVKRAFKAEGPAPRDPELVEGSRGDRPAEAMDCALALAASKACHISRRCPSALVIGADQILVCDGVWFDKPVDMAAARAQLLKLRGQRHELATAACVAVAGERIWHTVSRPFLAMRAFSDEFLDAYLTAEGKAILGSVGAYRIEGRGAQLFTRIDGDHFAVLGLPLFPLLAFLRDRGALAR